MRTKGFTIVELLVVIVVIGILATIVVVGYNGIQDRAMNISRVSAARQTLSLMQSYHAINGNYPALPDNLNSSKLDGACLGSGWPEMQGQEACWNIFTDGGSAGASTFFVDDSVNQELATVGTAPDYPTDTVDTTPHPESGRTVDLTALALMYRHHTPLPEWGGVGYKLAYLLKGTPDEVDCGISGALESRVSPQSDATRCVIPLSDG